MSAMSRIILVLTKVNELPRSLDTLQQYLILMPDLPTVSCTNQTTSLVDLLDHPQTELCIVELF